MKIYRTVIQYEILSSEPYNNEKLEDITYQTFEGDWSGLMLEPSILNEVLEGDKAIEVIKKQGTDPEFFNFEDENE